MTDIINSIGTGLSKLYGMLVAPIIMPSIVIPLPKQCIRASKRVRSTGGVMQKGRVHARHFYVGENKLSTFEAFPLGYWDDGNSNDKQVVIVMFGNAAHLDAQYPLLAYMAEYYNTCIVGFDFRYVGESGGWWASGYQDLVDDALLQIDRVMDERQMEPRQILLYGCSLGGSIAVHTAASFKIQNNLRNPQDTSQYPRVFADRTFASVPAMAPYFITLVATSLLGQGELRDKFSELCGEYISKLVPLSWAINPSSLVSLFDDSTIAVLNYKYDSMIPEQHSLFNSLTEAEKEEFGFLGTQSMWHQDRSFRGGFLLHDVPLFNQRREVMSNSEGYYAKQFIQEFIQR